MNPKVKAFLIAALFYLLMAAPGLAMFLKLEYS